MRLPSCRTLRPWPRPLLILHLSFFIILVSACSPIGPSPKPTAVLPTPYPTPSQDAAALSGEDPDEVEAAFNAEVQQAIDQAHFLAGVPCDELADAIKQNRDLVPGLRAYAGLLKSLAARDRSLARPRPRQLVLELDDTLAELDRALAACRLAA